MKFEIKILKEIIKHNKLWFIVLFILSVMCILFFSIRINPLIFRETDLYAVISYPTKEHSSIISSLFSIYQIIFTIYLTYVYYTYEINNSFENVILRFSEKRWFVIKSLLFSTFITVFRVLFNLCVYIYFAGHVEFSIDFIISPVCYHLFIVIITMTIINFVNFNKVFELIITFIISYLIFMSFNLEMAIILLFILYIFNLFCFSFKKYYQNESK